MVVLFLAGHYCPARVMKGAMSMNNEYMKHSRKNEGKLNLFIPYVDKYSAPVLNIVEKEAVRKFAEAIGDLNPLYVDEVMAQKSIHGKLIAPPTFPRTFDYGLLDGFPIPRSGLIQGEQRFIYNRPLYVGDKVQCSFKLEDVFEKKGSKEWLTFFVMERRCDSEDGMTVLESTQVLIATEKVMEGIQI